MIGYIVNNKNGDTLTKNLFWYPRDENEGLGYVFSEDMIDYIKENSRVWPIKPFSYRKAKYNEINDTVEYLDDVVLKF